MQSSCLLLQRRMACRQVKIGSDIRPFFTVREDITVQEGLLLYRTRLVIPVELRRNILSKIHDGQQGIVKCRALAKCCVWWPGLSHQIQSMVENCATCEKERKARPEPLKPSSFPDYPWQKVGMDLFDRCGQQYLLVVDYFSRNFELAHVQSSASSETVIAHCKSIFARHGIPEVVQSDNGPQFASHKFARFATDYGFTQETNSPHYPQANGEAERAVQTVKNFLLKAEDPYLALLNYRATPLQCGFSPAEMSMGRHLRTRVSAVPASLAPDGPRLSDMKLANANQKKVQKNLFDSQHRATPLPTLSPGEPVWMKEPVEVEAGVVRPIGPRSYAVGTLPGLLRRNRRHLNRRRSTTPSHPRFNPAVPSTLPGPVEDNFQMDLDPAPVKPQATTTQSASPLPPTPNAAKSHPEQTTTRSGRVGKAPPKLDL